MSTKGLSVAQQEAILSETALLGTTGKLTTAELEAILVTKKRNKDQAEALLINTGLITSETAEATATNVVTAAKLKELVQTKALTQAEADLIAAKAGVTLANQKESVSLLAGVGAKIKGAGTALKGLGTGILTIASAHPVIAGITAAIALCGGAAIANKVKQEKAAKAIKEAYENAKTAIDDINNTFKENSSKTKEIAKEYAELAQGVNLLTNENKKLSTEKYERFLDLSNQLSDLYPSLTKSYDENGNAILDLSGDVNTIVGSLDDLIERQRVLANQEIVEQMPDLFKGYSNNVTDYEDELKKAESTKDAIQSAYDEISKYGIYTAFDINGNATDTNGDPVALKLGQYIDLLKTLGITAKEVNLKDSMGQVVGRKIELEDGSDIPNLSGIHDAFVSAFNQAQDDVKYAQQQLDAERSSINQYLNTWLQTEFSYNQIEDNGMQKAIQEMLFNFDWDSLPETIDKNDWEAVSEYLRRNILFAINNVQDNPEISKAISEVFNNAELTPDEKANYLQQIQDFFGEDSAIVISLKPQIEETDTLQKQYDDAITKAKKQEADFDWDSWFKENSINTQEEVDRWNEIAESATNAADARKKYTEGEEGNETDISFTDQLSRIQSLSEGLDQLGKIYLDVKDKEDFDWSSILNNDNFKTAFGDLGQTYDDFIKKISNTPDDISACQSAFDDLATSYIYNSDALQNVTEETKDATIAMLEMMGIENAKIIVDAQLQAQTMANKLAIDEQKTSTIDGINAIYSQIDGLLNESDATGIATTALYELIAQETIFSNSSLDTTSKIQELEKLAKAFGVTADAAGVASAQANMASEVNMALRNGDAESAQKIQDSYLSYMSSAYEDAISAKFGSISSSYSGGNKSNSSSGSSGSSGSSSNKDFDWMELKLKKIEQLRTKLQNQSNNSFLTYMGLTDEEVRQAEKIANELTGIYGESISKIEDLLPSGESDKKITDVMSAIQNQINVLSGSYDKVVSEDTINDLQSLSSMANTAGLSLEEFINLIKSGGRESRQSALASLIEYNKQTLPEYEKAVKEYGKKYAEALSKLPEEIRDKVEHGGEGIESFSGQLAEDIQAAIDYGEKLSDAETTLASKKQESQDTIKSFYEDEINYLDAEYQKLENSSNLIEAEIDYLNESGRIVNATSYESIIANLQQQEKIIDKKIAEKKAELRALMENDENYKNSPEYYELLDSLGECEKAQKELNKLEEQYNRQLREMPVDNLDKVISMSNSIIDAMENWRAEQEAFGKKVNAEYYQELIINGAKTIDQYKEQADLIEDIMDEYEIGSEPWLDMYDRLKQCNTEMSSMVQNLQKWNEELLQMPIDNIATYTDDLNKVLTALNSVKSDHETVINAVVAAIDDEIDRLNDEKEVYEENVNDEIDILQDKLDLLKEQNRALELQRDYEQSLYDLQVANTQKTEAVIRNGEKVYETNADNIRNAQSSVTDALEALKENEIQTQIDDLNDALDAYNDKLEDQIDALEKIKEKWSEIATEREKADNAALATEILGNGWQNKVITGNDNDIYTMFKNLYNSNIDQINQYQDQITSTENIESLIQDYITSYKEGTISYQEAQAGIQNLLSQMNEKMTSDENLQNVYDYLGTVHDTDANGNAILEGIQKSLDKTSDELLDAFEQYNENIAMIGEYTTSWEQLTNNVDEMRDLLEEVRDNLEDALDAASDRDDDDDGGSSGHWLSGDSGNGPGVHAKGILAGKVGGDSNTEKDKMIKYLTTHELDPGQIPIIADKGEYVVNPEQQELLLENYGRAMSNLTVKLLTPSIDYSKFGTTAKNQDINVNFEKGSIVLNEVQNVDEFAKAMDKNFALKMGQLLSKYDRFH